MSLLSYYLVFAALLFAIGFLGVLLNRRNVIVTLIGIELMLLASTVNFVAFSTFEGGEGGMAFAMINLGLAAAEAAVALALLVLFYRHKSMIDIDAIPQTEDAP